MRADTAPQALGIIAFAEKAQVVNRRVCKVDDTSPGLTHISAFFVHGEPFFEKKALQLQAAATGCNAKARKLRHLELERQNPQVFEKNLAADQDEHDAARDCRTLLVARAESVSHGDSPHGEDERRHADNHDCANDVHT